MSVDRLVVRIEVLYHSTDLKNLRALTIGTGGTFVAIFVSKF